MARLWRAIIRAASVVLLLGAALTLVLQVRVDEGSAEASCGSTLDVVTGRTGWEEWWSRDLADPAEGVGGRLVRSEECPGAVDARLVRAGVLAAVAVALWATVEVADRRRHGVFGPAPAREPSPALGLQRVGTVLSWVGAALTVGGFVAIVVLVADPDSTLFLYVDRLVVAVIGAIVLIPALALVFAGRAIALAGQNLARSERIHPTERTEPTEQGEPTDATA